MPDPRSIIGNVERKTLQKKALALIEDLPSLNDVVREFLAVSNREYFTAADFEKVIAKDSALVARLLKVSNSSFYAGTRQVKTIRESVVLIGMDNMKNMVYAVSASGLLLKGFKNYYFTEMGFWQHSLAVALTCRVLCEHMQKPAMKPEIAFVAGLLHDIGKLILDKLLDEPEPREIDREAETVIAGLDHAELARHILRRWKIPEAIIEAVRFHHEPYMGGRPKPAAVMINLADTVVREWGVGTRNMPDLSQEIDVNGYLQEIRAMTLPRDRFTPALWEIRQKLGDLDKLYELE